MALQSSQNPTPVRQPVPFLTPVQPGTSAVAASALLINGRWEQLILRFGFFGTGALMLNMAYEVWSIGQIGTHRALVFAVFAEYAMAFALLVAGVLPAGRLRRLAPLILVSAVAALSLWFYAQITINLTVYGTDNAAFSHVAAERLIDGENPYAINDRAFIEETGQRFGVPATFITATTDGKPLSNLMSWPAGSVLVVVPALLLGVDDVRWVVVAFEIAVLVLLWFRAPRALRPLIVLPFAADPNLMIRFTGGGVMDFVWVLPVLASVIFLYANRLGWAALLFGLAAGTKQQPWLLAPFLLIWVWYAHHDGTRVDRVRAMAEFSCISGAGFMALNLPFILWDLDGWMRGVLLPFREQLVPFGSGISLLTTTGIADLPKDFYTASTFGVWGLLLLAYALHFRTLKHAVWLAPAVIMWFGYRSLQNYFIFWAPMLFIALFAWWEEQLESDLPESGAGGQA